MADTTCLAVVVRPEFNDECKRLFNANIEKSRNKLIKLSQSTGSIVDRLILGFDNIKHDMTVHHPPSPFGDGGIIRHDLNTMDM